jgi:dTDP-4-amino-4,6-dideoxygalactose transaminase
MAIRHQLAVYSPIPFGAPMHGVAAALRVTPDPRPALVDLLRREYAASAVVLTGSGTQALQVAIENAVHRIGSVSRTVALPAFSCFDVASAAIGAGVSAALYDLDPDTLGPDLGSFERVLAAGVRVAVIAPLYGVPVDWQALEALAIRYGALLIEDSAQGHGATWRGKPLGAFGEISTLSFGRGKGWTGGGGGAVLVRRRGSLESAVLPESALGGETKSIVGMLAQWTLGRPEVYGIPHSIPALGLGETTYHPPVAPTTMPRAASAAVLRALGPSRDEAERRRENARWLLDRIPESDRVRSIRPAKGSTPGYLRLPIRLFGGIMGMEESARALTLGIAQSYPRSLVELAPRLTGPEHRWPGSAELVRDLVTLPTHSRLTPVERDEIVRMLQEKPR